MVDAAKKTAVKKTAAKKTTAKKKAAKKKAAPKKTTAKKTTTASKSRAAVKVIPGQSLVIVESPTKIRTLSRLLGKDYTIMASVGHVSDLPTKELGVDVEDGFKPRYETIRGKAKVLNDLKRAAKTAEKVYLAPDPDREGEAIAWHVAQAIDKPPESVFRITFDEITRRGVEQGLASPRQIDMALFEAQQARRILDRLVGYKISPLLWKKVRRGLSAGRVQSVAVRLICEREEEIRAFNPEEYWSIDLKVEAENPPPFAMALAQFQGEKVKIGNEEQARAILDAVGGGPLDIQSIQTKDARRHPAPPFITSTLQQEAARKLHFTAKRTMSVAQRLYEGVELNGEHIGLITYMRTDSTRIAGEALTMAREYITGNYPPEYLPENPNVYRTKKSAQDAHEAIRPTDVSLTPDMLKGKLDKDQQRLYELIWKRFLASQMTSAVFEQTRVEAVAPEARDYLFVATGQVSKFKGFLTLYQEGLDDQAEDPNASKSLPKMNEGEKLSVLEILPNQHFTQPPPRFTEATLVRELEKQGIGRPSTYASIISVIQEKEYAIKDRTRFAPSELGELVNGLLVECFPNILDVGFTANMEDRLDHVEDGSVEWHGLLDAFYKDFEPTLQEATQKMRNVKAEAQETDIECDQCGKKMVIKWGRNGKFLACPGYPECKNTRNLDKDGQVVEEDRTPEELQQTCPNCGQNLVVKTGRNGRFAACPGYPNCKHAEAIKTGAKCPNDGCDGDLVERYSAKKKSTFYSCNQWPKCKYIAPAKPVAGTRCAECGHSFLVEDPKADPPGLRCPAEGCGYKITL